MINIVIPMAGRGQRFKDAGYTTWKPYLPIPPRDIPMISAVMENVRPVEPHSMILLTPEKVGKTEGAACTVLKAKPLIDNMEELVIVNSDQLVSFSIDGFLADARKLKADGSIIVFPAKDDRWSFAKVNRDTRLVSKVAEKERISSWATAGIYYFRHGYEFVKAAEKMIRDDKRVNGEFYVCPVYNELIAAGARIFGYKRTEWEMHGLGVPDDYKAYCDSVGS